MPIAKISRWRFRIERLRAAAPSEAVRSALTKRIAKWREYDDPTDRIIGYRDYADDLEKALGKPS